MALRGEGSNLLVQATTCCHHLEFLLGAIYPTGRTDRKTIKDYQTQSDHNLFSFVVLAWLCLSGNSLSSATQAPSSWGPIPQLSLYYSTLPSIWPLGPLKYHPTPVTSSSPWWLSPVSFFSTPLITLISSSSLQKRRRNRTGEKLALAGAKHQCSFLNFCQIEVRLPRHQSSSSLVKLCNCL